MSKPILSALASILLGAVAAAGPATPAVPGPAPAAGASKPGWGPHARPEAPGVERRAHARVRPSTPVRRKPGWR